MFILIKNLCEVILCQFYEFVINHNICIYIKSLQVTQDEIKKKSFFLKLSFKIFIFHMRLISSVGCGAEIRKPFLLYIFTRLFCRGPDTIQGQFLSGIQPVLIQNFLSPRLVVLSRLKNLVWPTIYAWREKRWSHAFTKDISMK